MLDSGSTDDTEIEAIAAGARVVTREQAVPEVEPQPGKGEVLWRSLAATTGDIIVFVDSDLIDPDPMFVPRLVGPLLTGDGIHLVKGFYRRPLRSARVRTPTVAAGHRTGRPSAAGRAAPRTGLRAPAAGRRVRRHPRAADLGAVRPGYGVEIGLLVDTYDRLGLQAIAQVNLGVRSHRNRPLIELGAMSRQVIATLAVPVRHHRLRDRADAVPARRARRLPAADHQGLVGRPAADEHPALTASLAHTDISPQKCECKHAERRSRASNLVT